jgi:hypothetical protein
VCRHRRQRSITFLGGVQGKSTSFDAQYFSLSRGESMLGRSVSRSSQHKNRMTIHLLSDNAISHSSSTWNRSLLMPGLDNYHPMDDYMLDMCE